MYPRTGTLNKESALPIKDVPLDSWGEGEKNLEKKKFDLYFSGKKIIVGLMLRKKKIVSTISEKKLFHEVVKFTRCCRELA